ncbi:MAG: hypothetical protein ACLP1X_25755 [Polyangiaceae bacterium]
MIKTPLGPCPVCARHVRVSEPSCPFCRAELPSSFQKRTMPLPPAVRLSRAALYALGVGTLSATTAACGGGQAAGAPGNASPDGSAPSPDGSMDGGQDDAPFLMGAAPYGLAPIQTCDSSADCVSGDTCGPQGGDPSIMVCHSCTSAAGCLPGQVCCGESGLTTSCQTGPCPNVAGLGAVQLCATAAECLTVGDVCTSTPSIGVGSMGFGGVNEVDGGSSSVCNAPSSDGGTESGRADGGDESDGAPD